MKRPSSAKSDKFYPSSNSALREQRVSIVFTLVIQTLLFLVIAFAVYAWIVSAQFKLAMHQQADALGQSLISQTTQRAAELITIDDKLGINIVLGGLAKNPLVSEAVIYDTDNKELYRAGLKQAVNEAEEGRYCEPLVVQQHRTGKLCVLLNMQQFQSPWVTSIERTIIIAGLLLFIGLIVSFRLGRKIISPVIVLREWMYDPVMPAPLVNRMDEIGDLARDLQIKLIPSEEIEAYYARFIEPEPIEEEQVLDAGAELTTNAEDFLTDKNFDKDFLSEIRVLEERNRQEDEFVTAMYEAGDVPIVNDMVPETVLPIIKSAVLFIRLGGQDQLRLLPRKQLISLLQRYRDCLNQTVRLYRGEIHTLSDGSSVVLFHGRGNESESYLLHAICCGELMRALSHELQIELAETNIALLLEMALGQGEDLLGLTPSELADNETVQSVKFLSGHSRNLLLIDQTVVMDAHVEKLARVRALANPADTYCIERVLEPYAEILEKQLRNMRNSQL